MLIYVILLSSDCFKVQGHLVPRLSRTNTSNATDNNIKNIYNEEDILHVTGIAVFDCTLHRLCNYGPQSRGTAGVLIFWLQVSGMNTSVDPEGVQGVRTPPPLENHKLYGFL